MKAFLASVLIFLSLHSNVYAWGLKELGEEAASPVTTDAKYYFYTGTLLTIGLVFFEDTVSDPFQEKQVRNDTLGAASPWGDWMGQLIPNFLYVSGMSIASQFGDTKAWPRAVGMFKATTYSAMVTTALKYTIREPRPNDIQEKNSFPSGHTTSAFAFSGYVAAEHGWGWGSAALLLSSFTAYSRINDNRHFLHDVFAGATIGWGYGYGISMLQKKDREREEKSAFIVPILDSQTAGISMFKEF